MIILIIEDFFEKTFFPNLKTYVEETSIYKPNAANFIYIERNAQERTEIITLFILRKEFTKDLNEKISFIITF